MLIIQLNSPAAVEDVHNLLADILGEPDIEAPAAPVAPVAAPARPNKAPDIALQQVTAATAEAASTYQTHGDTGLVPLPQLFGLGRILITPGAQEALQNAEAGRNEAQVGAELVLRHSRGDWGCICREDRGINERALVTGARLLSVYELASGQRIWLITEASDERGYRFSTTILHPAEY